MPQRTKSAPAETNTNHTTLITVALAELPSSVRIARGIWNVNPFYIAGAAFLLGFLPFLYAIFFSPIGSVIYYKPLSPVDPASPFTCTSEMLKAGECIEKQVGYSLALNWWPILVVLAPLSLFFSYTSIQNTKLLFSRMIRENMLCDHSWQSLAANSKEHVDSVKGLMKTLWTVFAISSLPIVVIVVLVITVDFHCVVSTPLIEQKLLYAIPKPDRPVFCKDPSGQEVDWSIAAIISQADGLRGPENVALPSVSENYLFSAYVYFLLAIELCILLAFFCFIFALSLTTHRLERGAFNLRLVPNLRSNDKQKRMGFENFETVFQPAVFVTILFFIMAFLMRIQNEYLRSGEGKSIFEFLFGDVGNIVSGEGTIKDVQSLFDIGQLADPNSQIAAPTVMIVFALVSVALGFILRHTATASAKAVERGVKDDASRLETLYGVSKKTILKRLAEIEKWPLAWPKLRQMMIWIAMGIACFFFYKLAFAWIAAFLIRFTFPVRA